MDKYVVCSQKCRFILVAAAVIILAIAHKRVFAKLVLGVALTYWWHVELLKDFKYAIQLH